MLNNYTSSTSIQGEGAYSILFRVPNGASDAIITGQGGTVTLAANQSLSFSGNLPWIGCYDLFEIELDAAGTPEIEIVKLFLVG